jgi:hypothetical protein
MKPVFFSMAIASLLTACTSTPSADNTPPDTTAVPTASDAPSAGPTEHGARREMTQEDCTAKGGTLVGDIGNGATHRPDFRCPSGSPPIGNVPLGVEGSVCCL